MAQNTTTAVSADAIFAFVMQSEDENIKAIDLTTDEGYQKAHALLVASLGGVEAVKANREAQDYTVLVLNMEKGTFSVLGHGKGTVGRAPSDPSKWNDLQRMESRGSMIAKVQTSKGERTISLKVLSEDLAG